MSDFVNHLLGTGGADGPPIRPLIGSLFEPRRRTRVWPPLSEPSVLPTELEGADPPGAEQEHPAGALPDLPQTPRASTERPAAGRAPEPPQAVRAEPPAGPARPAEPAAFALPTPRRAGAPPEEPAQEEAPPERHTTPEEPAQDAPAAPAPDPVRAHAVPPSPVDAVLADPRLTPRRERAAAAPNVRITIGRVEVRAGRQPPVPQPPRRIPGRRPAMSLEDYLRTRSEGGGGR
ncbi:hypothetical protein AB0C76_39380 [Kitasatospora sp. NPDC048722]|uniref:hypothetical protein n=1 Tax=Kitasatospora sp. NPDC048722 TaxID=3155639 RepID=UPI003402ADC7